MPGRLVGDAFDPGALLTALASATGSFNNTVVVLGALLVGGALVAGIARRSFLSLTAIFVVAGFLVGPGWLDVIHFDPRSGFVNALATVALIVILFRDGLEVEAEMLQSAWRLPLRKLVLAMPLTGLLVAAIALLLTDLTWTESLLLGALLSPTDPVLSSAVVTNPRVPRAIRHSLNLESGLNDGLALPAVLAFAAALDPNETNFVLWKFLLQDISVGLATGLVLGVAAGYLLPRGRPLGQEITPHEKALYALGAAFATYGVAVLTPPKGNGFIAVFVAAIVLGIRRPDVRECFEHRSVELIELVKLAIFVVFGALLTFSDLFNDGWAAVGIVAFTLLAARPLAIVVALAGTRVSAPAKAFMAWFGPKGVATMTFSILILNREIAAGTRIFDIAALAVFASIIVHGLTDHAGADWMAARAERDLERERALARQGGEPLERAPAPG